MTLTLTQRSADRDAAAPWYDGLDSVRFFAAFCVLAHHAGFSSGATFRWDLAGSFLARMDAGVEVFFVLSGFLLYRPFVAAQFSGSPAPRSGPFWTRRAARIFPAYWCAFVVIVVFGGAVINTAEEFVAHLLLLQIYVPDETIAVVGITQSWTLATELGFYLLLPLLAQGARHLVARHRDGVARTINRQALWLLGVCAALAVFSVLFRAVMEKATSEGRAPNHQLWTLSYLDVFGAGMALAVVSAWGDHRQLVRDTLARAARRTWPWWAGAAVVFWFTSTQLNLQRGLATSSFALETTRQSLYGLIAVLLIAPVVFGRRCSTTGLRLLERASLRWLGAVSYGIYLWHVAFMRWTHELLDWPALSGNFVVLVVVATVGSVTAAALSHRFVEEPVMARVRDRQRTTRARGSR
jgi:peptidoglycan/LPS O-acetylase OafA/YrhL